MGLVTITPSGLDGLDFEVFEHMEDCVTLCDDAGRVVYCNVATARTVGVEVRECKGRPFWELWRLDDEAPLREAFRRVGKRGDGEAVALTLPESRRHFECKIFLAARGVCVLTREVDGASAEARRDRSSELIAALPGAVSLHRGPGHRIEIVNREFERQHGARTEGRTASEIWHRPAERFIAAELDAVFRTGEPLVRTAVPMIGRVAGEPSRERYVTYSLTPLRERSSSDGDGVERDGGAIVGVVRFALDVTEEVLDRIALEGVSSELRAQSERHRLVARATNDALWDWDIDAGTMSWNDALHTLFGYDERDVRPTFDWWLSRVHEDDRARVERSLRDAIAGNSSAWSAEYRFVRKDGSAADVLDRAFVMRDGSKRAERVVGSILDLSERKRLERALLESQGRLRSSLAAANIGTWRVDLRSGRDVRDGTLNAIFGLGASETDTPAEAYLDRVHPEDRATVVSAIDRAIRQRDEYSIHFRIVRPDGAVRWVRDVGRVLSDESGPFAMTGAVVDLTEMRRAEESIHASELRYRSLVLATHHLLWTTDPKGRVAGPQPLWCAFTGQRLEAALGEGWLDAVHPTDRETIRTAWNQSVARRRVHEAEFRIRRYDGTYRHVLARAAPVLSDDGVLREWIATAVDLTDKKTTEAQLEAVFEGAPIGISILDRGLRFVRVNRKMAELDGIPVADHAGRSVHEVVTSTSSIPGELARLHHDVLDTGDAIMGIDLAVPDQRRGTRHWLAAVYPVTVDDETTGTVGIAVEITARKAVEQSFAHLARTSRELASSLDLGTTLSNVSAAYVPSQADFVAIMLADSEGTATLAACCHARSGRTGAAELAIVRARVCTSGGVRKLLRTPSTVRFDTFDEDARRTLSGADTDSVAALDSLGFESALLLPLVTQGSAIGAVLLARERGPFGVAEVPLAEELARRAAVAIQNARLFELARREQVRVEEANRAKDEFLAVVSHELRTPLNAVLGWSKMLLSDSVPPAQRQRAIESIERNARAQAQLIEDLLDISRIITGKLRLKLESVDLTRVATAAVEVVRPAATAKGVVLEFAVNEAVSLVGDADRLQQVLWNLLSNAVKFTPTGGRVLLTIHRSDSTCMVVVEDSGQGIHGEFLPHIFDRFRQAEGGTTRPHGGLGLGLAIVRHLAELHGGKVEATSAGVGLGSRFVLELPLAPRDVSLPLPFERTDEPPPPSVRPPPRRPSLAGLDVLIVDDEPDARELMESILTSSGACVRTTGSAPEAFAELRRAPPHVLISDIAMPGEDGYALIARVRALAPEDGGRTPAIALTAYARVEDRRRAMAAGFTLHMCKPVEPGALLSALATFNSKVGATQP